MSPIGFVSDFINLLYWPIWFRELFHALLKVINAPNVGLNQFAVKNIGLIQFRVCLLVTFLNTVSVPMAVVQY